MKPWVVLLVVGGFFLAGVTALGVLVVAAVVLVGSLAEPPPPPPPVAVAPPPVEVVPLDPAPVPAPEPKPPRPVPPQVQFPEPIELPDPFPQPLPPRLAPPVPGPQFADPQQALPPGVKNTNAVGAKFRGRLTVTASSAWAGKWAAEMVVDGNAQTSWFSHPNAVQPGVAPQPVGRAGGQWLRVKFPEATPVARVTVLGNREPNWLNGYTVSKARLVLFDGDGKELAAGTPAAVGDRMDFDFTPPGGPIAGVRAVEVQVLEKAPGGGFSDVALAEVLVE